MQDHTLEITPTALHQLAALKAQPKFHAEDLYPGAPNEHIRTKAEHAVNVMIDRLQAGLSKSPQKSFALAQFIEMLKNFEDEDTEEREQACEYCEQIMAILNIKSSDGLLNKWLYGFDPDEDE